MSARSVAPRWAFVASVVAIFLLLHGTASALGSLRGEAGLAVGALVVLACIGAQRVFLSPSLRAAARALGLSRPTGRSLLPALGISTLLLLTILSFAAVSGQRPTVYPGWLALLPGLFAQGGVAEEILFRGYLFGNLRRGRTFWRAAMLSAGPFVAAHLLLFATMSWQVALAATLLALIVSFPLAHLFEFGGRTIWAPALVHCVIQGAVKIVEMPAAPTAYALVWLSACAIVPWLALAVRLPAPSAAANHGARRAPP